jgi:hypothetical protein
MTATLSSTCHDCGVAVGQLHVRGCDVEQCPYCGRQSITCPCEELGIGFVPDDDRMPWTGLWPGDAECLEFGWFCRRTERGWQPCEPDAPGAGPDINRLRTEGVWDRELKRFVKKVGGSEGRPIPRSS